MSKLFYLIPVGVVAVVLFIIFGLGKTGSGGVITIAPSYSTTSVPTNVITQVATSTTLYNWRQVQQDSNATLYCFDSATSTALIQSLGHRLTQGQEFTWSKEHGNVYPGKISCISSATSTVLVNQKAVSN